MGVGAEEVGVGLLAALLILVVGVALAYVEARRLGRLGPFQVFAAGWVLLIAAGFVSYLFARDAVQGIQDAIQNQFGTSLGVSDEFGAVPTFPPEDATFVPEP